MTNSAGAIQAQYQYDPYGRATKLQGSQNADFQYAGYYMHAPSGLNLTRTRQYSASLGRWISRDQIAEVGGLNLYGYVHNNSVNFTDPSGEFALLLAIPAATLTPEAVIAAAGAVASVGLAATWLRHHGKELWKNLGDVANSTFGQKPPDCMEQLRKDSKKAREDYNRNVKCLGFTEEQAMEQFMQDMASASANFSMCVTKTKIQNMSPNELEEYNYTHGGDVKWK